MDLWLIIKAAILGVIEGLTEFIPVSSTGHLIVFSNLLKFDIPSKEVFEVVIQLGSIFSICWLYRYKLFGILGSLHNNISSQKLALSITIAFLPSMIIGGMFHGMLKQYLFSNNVVAASLIIGGIIIIITERRNYAGGDASKISNLEDIALKTAFYIGLFQCLAMIPGVSRSGATIIGALLMGLNRKCAAEFSFFLAIPTIFAASIYDFYKNADTISMDDLGLISIGFITAFISGLIVVRLLIKYISTHNFTIFGYYRIFAGAAIFALLA